ncbi:MAG TPA: PLD nuclease N-terminal domain-containing protein [Pseudonocardiaceae bacterium]
MTTKQRTKWHDLPARRRRGIIMAGTIQSILALTAWRDLIRRPADRVNGPKPLWALAIAVNFVGPIAYFRWGRHDANTVATPEHEFVVTES